MSDKNPKTQLEKFEYISARVEVYLANFRDSIDYDFDKVTVTIQDAKKRLNDAMTAFSWDKLDAKQVGDYAKLYRDACRRPEQAAITSSFSKALKNITSPKEEEYITGTLYVDGVRELASFGERLSFWITEHNKRLFFAGQAPPPGVTSCMVEGGGGFDADGNPLSQYEAEVRINREVTDLYFKKFGGKPPKPEEATPPQEEDDTGAILVDTKGKTVDEVKAEVEKQRLENKLKKRKGKTKA
jgi:hypothetical protein